MHKTTSIKRRRTNEPPTPPVKRIKTSYFDNNDTVITNNEFGRTHRFFNEPSDDENKIVFLVSDKPRFIVDDNFDDNVFNDNELDDLLKFLESLDKPSNNFNPPSSKRPRNNPPKRVPPKAPPKTPVPPMIPKPDDPILLPPPNIFFLIPPNLTGDNDKDDPVITPPTKKRHTDSDPSTKQKEIECKNPLCNHKTEEEDPTPLPDLIITNIKSVDDLIEMGKAFHCKRRTTYNGLNLRIMNNLVAPLAELKDMIGMKDVKEHVVDQILFFLQGFNTKEKCNTCQDCVHGLPCIQSNTEMLHTVITGPPGVGKTCLGRIMGKVYKAMGILSKGEFHEVTRTDFVAGYLGQTALKTQKLIDKCKGGVMFIDEAYSMGSKEKRDSFAKEALDTLNKNLSDNRDLLCIIAGYEKDLEECFFSVNDGLKRRFSFRYNVSEYDYRELLEIFKLKVVSEGWSLDFNSEEPEGVIKYTDNDLLSLFRSNRESFPYSGGDVETYFLQCKIAHGRRIPPKRKCLSFNDLKNGFAQFTKNRKSKKIKKSDDDEIIPSMYTS